MSIVSNFGRPGQQPGSGIIKVWEDALEGKESPEVVPLQPDSLYLLITGEWQINSGALRGRHAWLLQTPDSTVFGTVAAVGTAMAASTNSGVTVSYPSDTSLKIQCSSASYRVQAALYLLD